MEPTTPRRVSTPIPGLGPPQVDVRITTQPPAPPQGPPPCDYCPPDDKRPAYRMVEAIDADVWGRRTRELRRYICAACEIRAWDIVLRPRVDAAAAPSASATTGPLEQRVRDLEDMVADLQEQLKHLASRPAGGDRR